MRTDDPFEALESYYDGLNASPIPEALLAMEVTRSPGMWATITSYVAPLAVGAAVAIAVGSLSAKNYASPGLPGVHVSIQQFESAGLPLTDIVPSTAPARGGAGLGG